MRIGTPSLPKHAHDHASTHAPSLDPHQPASHNRHTSTVHLRAVITLTPIHVHLVAPRPPATRSGQDTRTPLHTAYTADSCRNPPSAPHRAARAHRNHRFRSRHAQATRSRTAVTGTPPQYDPRHPHLLGVHLSSVRVFSLTIPLTLPQHQTVLAPLRLLMFAHTPEIAPPIVTLPFHPCASARALTGSSRHIENALALA